MNAPEEDIERLRADAADWFVRVHADSASEEDWLALEGWLATSPARLRAYEDVELLWSEIDDHAPALRAQASDPPFDAIVLPPARRPKTSVRAGLPAWAAIAAVLVVAVGFWLWRGQAPSERIFTTGKGETRSVALADGSLVELNSDSRLVARVSRTSRNLELTGGEALFEVAKDRSHPFRVTAGDQRITVVGTQFDVLRYRGVVSVTVSRGVVEVADTHGGQKTVRLRAGDQLRHQEGSSGSFLAKAPVDEVLAWRNGYLIYRDQPLEAVTIDINRFVPIPIEADPSVANLRFSGALRVGDEEAMLRALQGFLPVEAVRSPGRIWLRSRSPHG